MTALLAVFAGLLGAAFGSFLNVLVHRVPRGISLVHPPSSCPSCETEIRPRDNIPIVSWLLLRGRCRACEAPISPRYPIVESVTTGVWVTSVLRFERLEEAAFVALSCTVLWALTLIDLEHRRIPNLIVVPSTAAALVWVLGAGAATGQWEMPVRAVACGAAFFTLLFVIAVVSGGMGFGDVKLGGFIGVVLGRFGVATTVAGVLAGFILGGLVAAALLALRRRGRKDALPFGPAMAGGAVIALFGGERLVRAWLGV
jgi:leader peptidase (prepilin peptidase)/N-methyltransferase